MAQTERRALRGLVVATVASLAAITCAAPTSTSNVQFDDSTVADAAVSFVQVVLDSSAIPVGGTTRATAVLRDANNRIIRARKAVAWNAGTPAVAQVNTSGGVTGLSSGTSAVIATVTGVSGQAPVTVVASDTATAPPPPPAPAAVASVQVSLSQSTLAVGATATATATLRDSSGNVLTGRAVTWQSSNTAVVMTSATGAVTAVAAGSANTIATSEGVSGSAAVTVEAPAPAPSVPGTNEPSDFVLITERDFQSKVENGWLDRGDANFSIQQDAGSPRPDHIVGQALFPAGFAAGSGPINTYYNIGGSNRRLYMSVWIKFSSNWQGQEAGVNKIIFIWIDASPNVFLNAQGTGSGPLVPSINLQNNVGGAVRLSPNLVGGVTFTRGVWHKWEVLLTANTVGQLDGSVRWWLDGVEIGRYNNIGPARDGSNRWEIISWNPTWGGAGGTVTNNMTQQIDHIRVSGLP